MKVTLHMLATLIVVGMFSGGALSLVNDQCDPLIKENLRKEQELAIAFLVPGGTPTEVVNAEGLIAWEVLNGTESLGWVVKYSGIGFQDKIQTMIALDPARETVRGMMVLDDKETPGLGTWIRLSDGQKEALQASDTRNLGDEVNIAQNFPFQFFGYGDGQHLSAAGDLKVVKGKTRGQLGPNEVQSITAATISSVAVADIVNAAVLKLDELLAGEGGV